MVKLKTEKFINRGEKYRKILDWEGIIPEQKLPLAYLTSGIRYAMSNDGESIDVHGINTEGYIRTSYKGVYNFVNHITVYKGAEVSEEFFQKMLSIMNEAGKNLHVINQRIKEMDWSGEETIIL